jgi:hypothetical protein
MTAAYYRGAVRTQHHQQPTQTSAYLHRAAICRTVRTFSSDVSEGAATFFPTPMMLKKAATKAFSGTTRTSLHLSAANTPKADSSPVLALRDS